MEMRIGFECTAVSLAAQRANAAGLEAIEKATGEMVADTCAGGLGAGGNLSFHMAIASATKTRCRSIS
jgi:DNA-binding FadR family transcriptional regulator